MLGREQHLLRALQHLLDHEQVDTLPHRNCPLPLQRHPNTPHLLKLVINHLQLA
ncbi:hypothetical protein FLA_3559 [Filimonas lacunae]|nr:hypothetical protein FLA_3559 [Filimonas lacunae]